jgi:lipoate-protein ligase A
MITELSYYIGNSFDPYRNLAVEEFLLETVRPGQMILYLWQNERTVVIGKNQNAWKECRFQQLEQDGGHLARRLSGGGAVFHDLGNLNFTFLMPAADYDLPRQMSVILQAVRALGIDAQKSGRNDVTVDGKKFSGNAFCQKGDNAYHHGTLMLQVDTQKVAHYLNVSEKKLRSKGVSSVTSRVCNLCDYLPQLDRAQLKQQMQRQLLQALGEVYGLAPQPLEESLLNWERISQLEERNASWEWKFGRRLAFTWERDERFDWGEVQLQLQIDRGIIQDALLYSDALDAEFLLPVRERLIGCRMEPDALTGALSDLADTDQHRQILHDLICLTCQQDSSV